MGRQIIPLKPEMTFSTKKVLLELVGLLCRNKAGETEMEIVETSRERNKNFYRKLRILSKRQVVYEGHTQEELFDQLKKTLSERLGVKRRRRALPRM